MADFSVKELISQNLLYINSNKKTDFTCKEHLTAQSCPWYLSCLCRLYPCIGAYMNGSRLRDHGRKIVCIMLGGAVGGIFRYMACWTSSAYLGLILPIEIFGINIIASFLLGIFMGRVPKESCYYKE